MTRMPDAGGEPLDAIIVGAGCGGLYMLHRLREAGFSARVIEAGSSVGGTWYWNRYPGARCDIESMEYSYSFSPELEREWRWTERYASQSEILRYLEHVADRFDLKRDILFDTRVTRAQWDEGQARWQVTTDAGATMASRFCIMATGNLSAPKLPDWPGLERFVGPVLHTAAWPEKAPDLDGKRIGVVGTGSSGIQAIPQLARMAKCLTVFQRTPSFAVPANNRLLTEEQQATVCARYGELREGARNSFLGFFDSVRPDSALADTPKRRQEVFEEMWAAGSTGLLRAYGDLLVDADANATAAEFARGKIAELVHDPATAKAMTPTGYPIGARRLCAEIGYFDAMNRDNVELVDLRETPVSEVTADGIETFAGRYPLDVLVFATGFSAVTGALAAIDIVGRGGRTLKEEWEDGPRTYLGLMVAGFPNLFLVTGPGSPSVLSNVVLSIEQHVGWIGDCLEALVARDATTIEASQEAEDAWVDHADAVAQTTLFPRANTWYQGRTRDGRQVFMPYVGGVGPYRDKCRAVVTAGYEGFLID